MGTKSTNRGTNGWKSNEVNWKREKDERNERKRKVNRGRQFGKTRQ